MSFLRKGFSEAAGRRQRHESHGSDPWPV